MTPDQRARIVFMGLVALDEAADRARAARGPVETCLSDRVVLAMLYAIAGRGRSSFYGFWRELSRPIGPLTGDATMRGNMLHTHFCGICQALGVRQTIAFTSALGHARREPMRGFRDPEPLQADERRARFPEFLRETMNDHREGRAVTLGGEPAAGVTRDGRRLPRFSGR